MRVDVQVLIDEIQTILLTIVTKNMLLSVSIS